MSDELSTEWIIYLPEGERLIRPATHPDGIIINVTRDCFDIMATAWLAKLNEATRPVFYFDHTRGEAAATFSEPLRWEDGKGIMIKPDWTGAGKSAIEGRNYSYFSPRFKVDENGRPVGFLSGAEVGSLTNQPAFVGVQQLAASQASIDEQLIQQQANTYKTNMDELEKLGLLTPDEAKQDNALDLAKARVAELKQTSAKCAEVTAELAKAKESIESNQKHLEISATAFVDTAVSAGKIAPKDDKAKQALADMFKTNPEGAQAIVASMASINIEPVKIDQPKQNKSMSISDLDAINAQSLKY